MALWRRLTAFLAMAPVIGAAQASGWASFGACETPPRLSAAEQHRVLRFASAIEQVLQAQGDGAALIARAGQDLSPIGLRYSHAGIASRGTAGAVQVRQLYFACDEQRPRLFDQNIAGFAMGMHSADFGFASILLLPKEAASALKAVASSNAQALSLLGDAYSANAYVYATRYQNCNQWVAEMLALAWSDAGSVSDRASAQRWLGDRGYAGVTVNARAPHLYLGSLFVPWAHWDDHPREARETAQAQVSVPESVLPFAERLWPASKRIELCHTAERVVVRRAGPPLDNACTPAPGDEVHALSQERRAVAPSHPAVL